MEQPAPHLSIGQVADRTGLSAHTLRFYERAGVLVDPVRRDAGGRRVYSEDDVDWLGACVKLRASGMPLEEIRRYADLVRRGPETEAERLVVLREHQARVTAQIGELTECLDLITRKIRIYEGRARRA